MAANANVLLRAIKGAWADRLAVLGADMQAAIDQLHILRAADEYLDLWGAVFGWPRLTGESDRTYGPRIINNTIRQRPQPRALEDIVWRETGVVVRIRNLWPMVLMSDQWRVADRRPAQVSDGHRHVTWQPGTVEDVAVRSAFAYPYLEGVFGVWMEIPPEAPFAYTLDNVVTFRPLVLLSDQLTPTTQHVSDGHLTTPGFGGPEDTARHSFAVLGSGTPSSVARIMALIGRHQAAGTEAVFMGVLPL